MPTPDIKTCRNRWAKLSEILRVVLMRNFLIKIALVLTKFASQIYKFTFILYGVVVRCDNGRFSLHSQFNEKSVSQSISSINLTNYI